MGLVIFCSIRVLVSVLQFFQYENPNRNTTIFGSAPFQRTSCIGLKRKEQNFENCTWKLKVKNIGDLAGIFQRIFLFNLGVFVTQVRDKYWLKLDGRERSRETWESREIMEGRKSEKVGFKARKKLIMRKRVLCKGGKE